MHNIENYISEQRKTDKFCYYKKQQFEQACYRVWARKELLYFVRQKTKEFPEVSILYSVEQFRNMMEKYSCKSNCICFSVAYDVATDVLDYLIGGDTKWM